jgi:hypothetical protein
MHFEKILGLAHAVDEGSVLGRLCALRPLAIGMATELFAARSWAELVAHASRWSRSAIELSALTEAELDSAVAYLQRSPPPIRHLSMHAPLALLEGGEERLLHIAHAIEGRVAAVIQHPHVLEQPAILAALGRQLALENMDAQKPSGRLVSELEPYFRAIPEAGFCLDVAHVRTLDPSMKLGHRLLDAFGRRLREVHVSGIDADCRHLPLDQATVELYSSILGRCRHVPWILESLPIEIVNR